MIASTLRHAARLFVRRFWLWGGYACCAGLALSGDAADKRLFGALCLSLMGAVLVAEAVVTARVGR